MAKKKRAFDPDTAAKYFDASPDLDLEAPHLESILLLYEIARIAGGDFHPADGWPDALTARELARLQFPDDDQKQADMHAVVWRVLDRYAVTVMRPHQDDAGQWQQMPEGAIERNAAADLIKSLRVEPSDYVLAWLKSGDIDTDALPDPGPDLPKPSDTETRARQIVETLEQMKHAPRALPPQPKGRTGIKRECRDELIGPVDRAGGPMSFGQFGRAWGWALKHGLIAEQPKP